MALKFKSPTPRHRFQVKKEKAAITRLFRDRGVPKSTAGRLLVASWNVANLGVQGRTPAALEVIAHILKRFDVIAVQEVKDEFRPFVKVVKSMGTAFDYFMSDPAGNTERLAYIYRKSKARPTHLVGEVALRARQFPKRTVRVRWTDKQKREKVDVIKNVRFQPFDRNPFIGSFEAGLLEITLVNVHLYFGHKQNSRKKAERLKYARRVLEIYALSRWAHRRVLSDTTYDKDMILLGDMNVPVMDAKESTYKALVKFGWQPAEYPSRTGGSNLGNDRTYDQMVFAPGTLGGRVLSQGVFDYDNAVFKPLWKRLRDEMPARRAISRFNAHVKHHFSDHRPMWVELDVS